MCNVNVSKHIAQRTLSKSSHKHKASAVRKSDILHEILATMAMNSSEKQFPFDELL